MKILLTGASGYLGSRLCRRLERIGHTIIALCLNRNEEKAIFVDSPRVKYVYLSEMSPRCVVAEESKLDGVIHTATLYGRSHESLKEMISANVIFPGEIISACADYKVPFFINTGTILGKYTSIYSLTKSQIVDWMEMFAASVKMVNLKLDHFYGPNDKNTKFVAMVLEKLIRNESTIDLTDGLQTRDFIYVDDVIDAFVVVLDNIDHLQNGKVSTFEVGSGVKTSIRSLVTKMKELSGSTSKLNFGAVPYRRNEMLDYDVDNSALRELGWTPKVFVDEGLKRIIKGDE